MNHSELFLADLLDASRRLCVVHNNLRIAGLEVEAARLYDVGRELGSVIGRLAKLQEESNAAL